MAHIITFKPRVKEEVTHSNIEDDFTVLFQNAVEDKKRHSKELRDNIIKDKKAVAERCRIAMNATALEQRMIDSAIFRCIIHTANVIAAAVDMVPESFYTLDYRLKALKGDSPVTFCEGADMCYLVCAFFPEYANRRCMSVRDYKHMGTQPYYKYYEKTKNTLGLCMGDNFKTMVSLAQSAIEDI